MPFSMTQIVFVATMVVSVVLFGFLGTASAKRMIERLKTAHPQMWKSLGDPQGLVSPSDSRVALLSFVVMRKYRQAKDDELTKAGDAVFMSIYVVAMDIVIMVAILGFGILK